MKTLTKITNAQFAKEGDDFHRIALPHTWNALDGQDGGGDYWRGTGHYRITLPDPTAGKRQYIQFEGANHIAEVSCNGKILGTHKGGFSTFRFELTEAMKTSDNELEISVFNGKCDVYPQAADFTFYGGLYRSVTFIEVETSHFSLMEHGSSGVFITTNVAGKVHIDAFIEQAEGCRITCILKGEDGKTAASAQAQARKHTVLLLQVRTPHLWNGLEDPFCYTATLTLEKDGEELDCVTETFGFRSYHVDPDRGFFLNGKSCPLHGVARHQDREDMGWAISEKEHDEDLAIIREIGANTIRLAHYQHAKYFYDLCDHTGFVLWAEIPFITMFMKGPEAKDNTLSQMTELILQNYNHPSIFFWGISNEISVASDSPELYANLCELNALAKRLDPARLTTMAQVSMLPQDSEHNYITDVLSYNHYFGWYMGSVDENASWLDEFHSLHPDRALGLSEYGAEAILTWHSANPKPHDYTEEYQALYHQKMLEIFEERPYLWATYVWNMFDFAADSRDEGGCKGRNNKGLVTYDRKIKKDAFYVCKAWWSKENVLHICGSRFRERSPKEQNITVCTNLPSVILLVNGKPVQTKAPEKHLAVFENVSLLEGENTITAIAGNLKEEITLVGTADPNPAYVLPDDGSGDVGNWFDDISQEGTLDFIDGYYSIRDKIGDLLDNPETEAIMKELFDKMFPEGTDVESQIALITNMALEPILTISKVPKGTEVYLNNRLNKIKKA